MPEKTKSIFNGAAAIGKGAKNGARSVGRAFSWLFHTGAAVTFAILVGNALWDAGLQNDKSKVWLVAICLGAGLWLRGRFK